MTAENSPDRIVLTTFPSESHALRAKLEEVSGDGKQLVQPEGLAYNEKDGGTWDIEALRDEGIKRAQQSGLPFVQTHEGHRE